MEKKFYTTIKMFPCISKNNNPYFGVTTVLNLSNFQVKDANGKKLVTARAAINNRTKLLNDTLGTKLPEANETAWVDVTFWEDRAERFQKFLGDRTKVLVCVMGTISARQFSKQDGTPGEALTISVDDWFGLGGGNNSTPKDAAPQPSIPTFNADDDLPY